MSWKSLFFSALLASVVLVGWSSPWNRPYSSTPELITTHRAFSAAPKTLDPAKAYSSDAIEFIAQIVEPPLQYHLTQRPYRLEPLTLRQMPQVHYLDQAQHPITNPSDERAIAYTEYEFELKPQIAYQPHPALATALQWPDHHNITTLNSFQQRGSRILTAADYVYTIKRLANPATGCPIYGLLSRYIVGFGQFHQQLKNAKPFPNSQHLDLRPLTLVGAQATSPTHFIIRIHGVYRQFIYWLAMPFFSPTPWEADAFYGNPWLKQHSNINFDWYPIGTGPYYLAKNNPNRTMILQKNPNYHASQHPLATPGSGLSLAQIDQAIYHLDRESMPRWNKFLQGYFDQSGIHPDSFEQAITLDKHGHPLLSNAMKQQGITLTTAITPSIFYLGFNWLDPVVGGNSRRARLLRQAISIAIQYEEYISIFMNGRGLAAQGPIPPGIFGHQTGRAGINPIVYRWDEQHHLAIRRSLASAKQRLADAGYPNGIDPKTQRPLQLNYDVASSGSPDEQSRFQWMRKQFHRLGIELHIRSTQYNRFQEKVRQGNAQLFSWGWHADYPDPENFLFLLYGPNGKVKYGGENASNYNNPAVNRLFVAMKNETNTVKRQQQIKQMVTLIRQDAPWVFGIHPIQFSLNHSWVTTLPANAMANNTLKYHQIDSHKRQQLQTQWNQIKQWPLWLGALCFLALIIAVTRTLRKRGAQTTPRKRL